jgi:CRP-like cAMP-binding protein
MGENQLYHRFGREFPQGEVLFREGEVGKEMYVIQSGIVSVSKKVRNVEKILATLGAGEFFGEMAIISNKPRTATAVVVEPARCLVIDQKTFEAMVCTNAEIAVRMIKKLADRLQEADAQIENLLLRDAQSRVVHHLVHAAQTRGVAVPGGIRAEINFSTLDRVLGIEEVQLNQALTKLDQAGLAWQGEGAVLIPDVQRLKILLESLGAKSK